MGKSPKSCLQEEVLPQWDTDYKVLCPRQGQLPWESQSHLPPGFVCLGLRCHCTALWASRPLPWPLLGNHTQWEESPGSSRSLYLLPEDKVLNTQLFQTMGQVTTIAKATGGPSSRMTFQDKVPKAFSITHVILMARQAGNDQATETTQE